MAIFRLGKRIGPFDVRTGISRGDLESSAYHKTDFDPRLRKPGHYRETTIGRFRAAMGKSEGFARPARFAIRIMLPTNLEKLYKGLLLTIISNNDNNEVASPTLDLGDVRER